MKILFSITVFLLGYSSLHAQKFTKEQLYKEELGIRSETMNAMSIKIKRPSKYNEVKYYVPPFDCVSAIHKYKVPGSNITYVFIKKDSSAAIIIVAMARDTASYLRYKKTLNFWHPGNRYDPDSVWRYNAKGVADTVNHPFKTFSSHALQSSNADEGSEFFLDCSNIFMDNYQVARGIILNKKYRGITEIYYFKRVGSKVDIDKEIEHIPNLCFDTIEIIDVLIDASLLIT